MTRTGRTTLWDGLLLILVKDGQITLDDVPEGVASREYVESVLTEMEKQAWVDRSTEDSQPVWIPGELATPLIENV